MKRILVWLTLIVGVESLLIACAKTETLAEPALMAVPASDFPSNGDAIDWVESGETLDMKKNGVDLQKAKELAIVILSEAADRSPARESELFRAMIYALERVGFDIPPSGKDLKQCIVEKNVLAFVMMLAPNTIHLCARALKTTSAKRLAQILIHETSHVVGVRDECQATRIEITAMRASRKGLAFHNGYMKNCGIK